MTVSSEEERQESDLALIDLSLGDPCYGPPREAKRAGARAMLDDTGGYVAPAGLPELRSALAAKLRRRNAIPATDREVVVTVGASLGLYATLAVLCKPGDGVLVPDPGFPGFRLQLETQRLRCLPYRLVAERDHEPDWDSLRAQADEAKLLIWNFPSNPLGTVARPTWIARLHQLLADHRQLRLVSDEVYEDLVFSGSHASPAGGAQSLRERCCSLFSFSKSYGMSGWRLGYVHAPEPIAPLIARAQWGMTMSVSYPAQRAGLTALDSPADYHDEVRQFLAGNVTGALATLGRYGFEAEWPDAGLFLWLDIRTTGLNAEAFAAGCAEECKVLLMPGTYFGAGGEGFVRISIATPRVELLVGLERIGRWAGRSAHAVNTDVHYNGAG